MAVAQQVGHKPERLVVCYKLQHKVAQAVLVAVRKDSTQAEQVVLAVRAAAVAQVVAVAQAEQAVPAEQAGQVQQAEVPQALLVEPAVQVALALPAELVAPVAQVRPGFAGHSLLRLT